MAKTATFVIGHDEVEKAIHDYLEKEYGIVQADITIYKVIDNIACSVHYTVKKLEEI